MIDWNALWNETLLASRSNRVSYYEDEKQAKNYDKSMPIRVDGEKRVGGFNFDKEWTVLDIGSGPGTLTIPLAKKVKNVTAVEPSFAMIQLLKAHIAEGNTSNIKIIQSKWEDIAIKDIGSFDVVIASYSLGMFNIKAAILKMDKAAKRKVYLYTFAGILSWEKFCIDLYPQIHGREYVSLPKPEIILNILYESGIYPDVKVLWGTSFPRMYSGMDAAIKDFRSRLEISGNDHDDLLQKYIEKECEKSNGKWVWKGETIPVRISWNTKNTQN